MTPPATTTGRGLRAACAAARRVSCGHCAAEPGQPCLTEAGRDGYHLARFTAARAARLITEQAVAAALMAAGPVFTPATLIPDWPP
ncbi:MAG: hypothetical protein J2P26_09130 [Nocardiopsaceae bacterium]|nr:hypothetical protein [Nocardiopsaceae bacterium]